MGNACWSTSPDDVGSVSVGTARSVVVVELCPSETLVFELTI